jgi:MarR family transcriptional regulator, organic hydroperoxide resistance regulator
MTCNVLFMAPASTLQREIRQRRPFSSPAHEGVVALLRTADLVRRHATALLEGHGITLQQFNVLRILRGAGDAGLPTLEVAGRMIEQTPGVTRLLDRLEAKGLVRRQRCPKDRRQHLCWITARGLDLLDGLDEPVHEANQDSLKGLGAREQRELVRLLDLVRAAHRETS